MGFHSKRKKPPVGSKRFTASTITDDILDNLYREIEVKDKLIKTLKQINDLQKRMSK